MEITNARLCGFAAAAKSIVLVVALAGNSVVAQDNENAQKVGKLVANLTCGAVKESSGLAASHREDGLLWTHNDSGGKPVLFAFDTLGKHLGEVKITGAKLVDWEDMASYQTGDQAWLLVADTGDNTCQREYSQLYILKEPNKSDQHAPLERVVRFTFEGGTCDCEAVAVDAASNQILMVTKDWSLKSKVFSLPLSPKDSAKPLVAEQIGEMMLPGVTGLDISSDGRRAIAITYGSAFEFSRAENEDWGTALSRQGKELELPARKQSEAICYASDGKAIFFTSEDSPTPLFRRDLVTEP